MRCTLPTHDLQFLHNTSHAYLSSLPRTAPMPCMPGGGGGRWRHPPRAAIAGFTTCPSYCSSIPRPGRLEWRGLFEGAARRRMAPDSGLQARVAQLEEELATQRAQVRAPAQGWQLRKLGASCAPRGPSWALSRARLPSRSTFAGRGGGHQRRAGCTGADGGSEGGSWGWHPANDGGACRLPIAMRLCLLGSPCRRPPPPPAAAGQRAALPLAGGQAHLPRGGEGKAVPGE